jgi:tRNA (guanine-N7-)-methyltransferase
MTQEIPLIRSFGRIKTRKLSNNKSDLHLNLLPKYTFEQQDPKFITNKDLFLEIGFGFGDFTFELAKNNPDANILGAETHVNGVVSLLTKLKQHPLNNIKIFQEDVRLLLEDLNDAIFDKIYILFPDPWPKTKHHKRRLINESFLELISKKIKKNGQLIIATDHDSYKEWIMSQMIKNEYFSWAANSKSDWQNFPKDWTYTKYQNKAKREGRQSIYLQFNLN